MKNLRGHDIILDAFATDSEGVRYNVEIQRSSHGAVPKRARYYSSMIDANILSSGDDYTLLTETYVIFITEKDVLGKGLPIYHIDRTIAETDDAFDDGSHIVYVNASVVDDSRLGRLMHDFKCAIPDDMKYAVLADKTRLLKDDDKEASEVCEFWEELKEEGRKEGIEQGRKEAETRIAQAKAESTAIKKAFRMILDGLSADKIVEYTDLPREEVDELIAIVAH